MKKDQQAPKQEATVPRSWWWTGLVGLLLAAFLPVIGHQLRMGQVRCALDGQEIDPLFRVTVVENDGSRHILCCISCSELWIQRATVVPRQVLVTDEVTGQRLNADVAYYVRSSVSSNGPTRDQRHVFSRREVADSHAKSFHGRVLTGDDRPFKDLPSSSPAVESSHNTPSVEQLLSS